MIDYKTRGLKTVIRQRVSCKYLNHNHFYQKLRKDFRCITLKMLVKQSTMLWVGECGCWGKEEICLRKKAQIHTFDHKLQLKTYQFSRKCGKTIQTHTHTPGRVRHPLSIWISKESIGQLMFLKFQQQIKDCARQMLKLASAFESELISPF